MLCNVAENKDKYIFFKEWSIPCSRDLENQDVRDVNADARPTMNEKELYMWSLQPHLTFSMSTNHSFNTYPVLQFVLGTVGTLRL